MEIKVLSTPTCVKCKTLKIVLEKLSKNYGISYEFINALENEELRNQFKVVSVPFIIFYHEGKVVHTNNGPMSEKEILSIVNKEI